MYDFFIFSKLSYKDIPEKINSSYVLERMCQNKQVIWYLPIKIGRFFRLICTINNNSTFSFLTFNQIYNDRDRFINRFNATLVNEALNTQLQFRTFVKFLQSENELPISEIVTHSQLKTYLNKYLKQQFITFFNTFIESENNDIINEITALKDEIYYVSPRMHESINKSLQDLIALID